MHMWLGYSSETGTAADVDELTGRYRVTKWADGYAAANASLTERLTAARQSNREQRAAEKAEREKKAARMRAMRADIASRRG